MDTPAERLTQVVDEFLLKLYIVKVDWESKASPGKWSNKEIIGHLLDSANINLHRFVRCTYEQNFKLVYAQNQWVTIQQYQLVKADDLLTLWRLLNRQISRVLANYPQGAWHNTCDTGGGNVTVKFIADDYISHIQHHLKQIMVKCSQV